MTARFCRHCGTGIEAVAPAGPGAGPGAAADSVRFSSAPPSFDDRALFRELCWLCGLPLAVSIIYTIVVRVGSASALADVLASSAVGCIALGGALLNRRLVGSALRAPSGRDWLATLLVALLVAPAVLTAFWVLEHVLGFAMWEAYLESYVQDDWPIWVGYADLALLTPIAEEVLFRGLVQPKLEQALTSTEAWIVQAALFAAAHLSPVILVTHFAMGLAFGWVRRRSGSLFPGILLHGAWNAWVVWSSSPAP